MTLLPYPISTLYYHLFTAIPCNLSSSFCSVFYRITEFTADILFLFLLLFLIFAITQNLKLISAKRLLLISVAMEILSFISRYLTGLLLYDSYKDPNLTLIKSGFSIFSIQILNVLTQIFLPSVIISLTVYLILNQLNLKKAFIISLIIFLVITQWMYVPVIWESSEQLIQRGLVLETTGSKSETKFFSGIKHEIVSEELITDPHSPKYKSLRINVKLTVPESYTYIINTELRDKNGIQVAVQSYVNGKSLTTSPIDISLNKGENLITFDSPFFYFNDYVKKEVNNLPSNALPTDTYAYTYGPFKFFFSLHSTYLRDHAFEVTGLSGEDVQKLQYEPPEYITKNTYNYLEFYQR